MNSQNKQDFIRGLFARMGEELSYCILRNYERLPEYEGDDIDLLIGGEDINEVDRIIIPIVRGLGWETIVLARGKSQKKVACLYTTNDTVDTLVMDISSRLVWRENRYADAATVLSGAVSYNGFMVAGRGADAAVTVTKGLIGRSTTGVKERYREKIASFAREDTKGFLETLEPVYGSLSAKIFDTCVNGSLEGVNALGAVVRGRVRGNAPTQFLSESIQGIGRRIDRYVHPKGKLIVFVGPDGSGKTTLIDKEKYYLEPISLERIKLFHRRYEIFPKLPTGTGLASMKGQIHAGESDLTAEKNGGKKIRRSTISKMAAWASITYYTLEYAVGNIIADSLIRRQYFILYDRYYYDHFAEPASRDVIWPYRKLLLALVRKPDLVIHLLASGEVIHSRKQQLSAREIDIANEYLSRVLECCDNVVDIRTDDRNADEVSADVFRAVIEKFYGLKLGVNGN